uniref:hypothetical protein n=1 Tax=Rhodoblastus sp. TaxID=1962975 RepID=UPI003F9C0669
MVSVTELSLFELRRGLRDAAADDRGQPPHARAFSAWIQHEKLDQTPLLKSLAEEAAAASGPSRQTAHAAVLGYAANMYQSFSTPFADAIDWLRQRQYFATGRPHTFEVDGLGLLGVAVGLSSLDPGQGNQARSWLSDLLKRSLQLQRPADWNESLIAAAYTVVTGEAAGGSDKVSADLRAAFGSKNLMQTTAAVRATAWDIISGVDSS